jgi:hypothetical protein
MNELKNEFDIISDGEAQEVREACAENEESDQEMSESEAEVI